MVTVIKRRRTFEGGVLMLWYSNQGTKVNGVSSAPLESFYISFYIVRGRILESYRKVTR